MPKTGGRPQTSQTHFEQVPVDLVKKIAEIDDAEVKTLGTARSTVERPRDKMVKSGRVPTRSPAGKK
jgi:hypothetical protein